MTPILVINLARRPDRMAAMTRRLDEAGLAFARIEAVDSRSADPAEIDARFAAPGWMGISPGDRACALSHCRAYERFLTAPEFASASHAVILEDDVRFSAEAGAMLSDCDWVPPGAGLVKLEWFPDQPVVLLGWARRVEVAGGRLIAPLLSMHLGGAAYLISRSAAAAILALEPLPMLPVDHLLFNPTRSPIFDTLAPLQLTPALFQQFEDVDSDIRPTWAPKRTLSSENFKREAARFYFQLRRLPVAMAQLAFGGARYRKIALPEAAWAGEVPLTKS